MLTNRKGFTLIELLIVVVIIGILAAIAIPKFAQTKDRAKVAAVRSEVRNLMTAAEGYFSDAQSYPTSLALVGITSPTPSGVALTFTPAGAGYTAVGTAAVSGGVATCTVITGGSGTTEGVITCVTS
jgi:prepilin-type N-terminal cleavage/methylation domain-containing protein